LQSKNTVSHERLAEMMLELQARGCHNIGFVSPTHFVPQMARAVLIAAENGLRLPIVYNTNAYDSVAALQMLDGIVDIYLPDLKYADAAAGFQYSKVRDYPKFARAAIKEMHRQMGSDLVFDENGLLKRGLLIRLLVLPNDLAGLEDNLHWIHKELGPKTAISLMAQYYATNKAATDSRYILLSRRISEGEWFEAVELLDELGFEEGFIQEYESASYYYRPDFTDAEQPFKDIRDFQ
jgi:putative pyruvate formate lyase activating enzyme